MEILNFGPSGSTPKKRRNRVALVVGALALAAIGSTFAASITLNSGSNIEYGQGLSQAVACDTTNIQISPQNTFVNISNGGAFVVDTLTVFDTNTTTSATGLGGCASKYLQLSAYGSTGNTILLQCKVQVPATYNSSAGSWSTFSLSGSACATGGAATVSAVQTGSGATAADGYQIVLTSPSTSNIAASGIAKFTLESSVS